MQTCIHTCIHTFMHTGIHTYMQTYMHPEFLRLNADTYIHIDTHTYTQYLYGNYLLPEFLRLKADTCSRYYSRIVSRWIRSMILYLCVYCISCLCMYYVYTRILCMIMCIQQELDGCELCCHTCIYLSGSRWHVSMPPCLLVWSIFAHHIFTTVCEHVHTHDCVSCHQNMNGLTHNGLFLYIAYSCTYLNMYTCVLLSRRKPIERAHKCLCCI